jgi:hypothetical protein
MIRRTRLVLQRLERRDVPGGVGDTDIIAGWADRVPGQAPGPGAPNPAANMAPTISDFRATVGPNGQVTFTGRVSDDTPVAGYVVRITGPGVDASAIVLGDGTFSVTTNVAGFTDVTVSAQTTDSSGAQSDRVYTTFTPLP